MRVKTIWDRIDAARTAKKPEPTKAAWASKLGVTGAVYNNWRSRGVPTDMYAQLMDRLGWSYERLVDGVQDASTKNKSSSDIQTEETDALFLRLSLSDKLLALALLNTTVQHKMDVQVAPEPLPSDNTPLVGLIKETEQRDGEHLATSNEGKPAGSKRAKRSK